MIIIILLYMIIIIYYMNIFHKNKQTKEEE